MRVLIMADMEGVSGIVTWDQVNGGAPQYEAGRVLYTEEINAAIRGAKAAGATEIVAVDCHGAGGDWSFKLSTLDLPSNEMIPSTVLSPVSGSSQTFTFSISRISRFS